MNMKSYTRGRRISVGAVVVIGLALSACSSDGAKTTSSSSPATAASSPDTNATTVTSPVSEVIESTTVPASPTFPLTGLPMSDPSAAKKPALVVKIDNHPLARPQSGLNEADIVFEENVEQLTRFAAVFQSSVSNPVGPIRSGRTQDIALLGSFNRPLFAWSGGNRRVTDAIRGSDLRQLSAQQQKVFFRAKGHIEPHDLYSNTDALYGLAPKDASGPPAQFTYRAAGATPAGDAIAAVNISMDGVKVRWRWDATKSLFFRLADGKTQNDAISNSQVSTDNVVVLYVVYKPSPADPKSPEAQTIGKGDAWVFTAGKAVKATWTRADRLQPFTLKDASGTLIALTPGRTFVELARGGAAALVPAGTDPASVPYP